MESLGTFAEFSLALAGFAAIALVLGQRRDAIPAGAIYVVRFMVINALGPGLLAMLAIVLDAGGVGEPLLWRLCSAVYLVFALFFALLSARQERVLHAEGGILLSPLLSRSVWSAAFVAHGIQLVNLIGYPWPPSIGLFLAGLWVLLVMAGVQFVSLLFLVLR